MKVGVTGATGFIGTAVCRALRQAGREVVALDLRHAGQPRLSGIGALVHLAAIAHRHASAEELQRINVDLAVTAARSALAVDASFVFVSSVKVYGEHSALPLDERSPLRPQDHYGVSKARAEEALRAIAGLRLAILRPPLVYGAGVKANFLFLMRAIAAGVPLPLASIANRRSVAYVGNVADAILACLGREGTFLVSDEALSTPQLCREIGAALGKRVRLFPFPCTLLPRKLSGSLELDDAASRRSLAWQPRFTRDEGLRATASWYASR